MVDLNKIGENAKKASVSLNKLSKDAINKSLINVADFLVREKEYIKSQNQIDVDTARKNNLPEPFIDRLILSDSVILSMAEGIRQVALLDSPVGQCVYNYDNLDQDIKVKKILVPFGVIGIIYEARPNVTADAFALCFKTQNAVILKGGKEAINSNTAVVNVIKKGLRLANVDENAISLIEDTSRETTVKFMQLNEYLDLLIPRGSGSLIRSAKENSTVPLIETGTGNCHIFVDSTADIDKAVDIIYNAKTQRYGVCNACESLVLMDTVYKTALPKIVNKLREKQVEIRCDELSYEVVKNIEGVVKADEEDFYTEYCAPIISVKVVSSFDEAIAHINKCSTHHSESILTSDKRNAERFLNEIDSSSVYVNASTRFTDGFVFGLGAEIGISTQKLHARGPMGLDALVTTKYLIEGNNSIRK